MRIPNTYQHLFSSSLQFDRTQDSLEQAGTVGGNECQCDDGVCS
uniref:Uncharacterized protein n=1 Tax=Arundo donax TaxID=35708 RepID=A0A0A9QH76_ARUDO